MGEEPIASLVAAAPDQRPNGPLDHRGHHEADERQSGPDDLAPARVVGGAALDTYGNRNARHLSHHSLMSKTELPYPPAKNLKTPKNSCHCQDQSKKPENSH